MTATKPPLLSLATTSSGAETDDGCEGASSAIIDSSSAKNPTRIILYSEEIFVKRRREDGRDKNLSIIRQAIREILGKYVKKTNYVNYYY